MNDSGTSHSSSDKRPTWLLNVCLLLSFLLHLIVVFVLIQLVDSNKSVQQPKPTFVTLVDRIPVLPSPAAETEKNADYEIDQLPIPQPELPPVNSSRKSYADQKVTREQAPKGEDSRDQSTADFALQPRPLSRATSTLPIPQQAPKSQPKSTPAPTTQVSAATTSPGLSVEAKPTLPPGILTQPKPTAPLQLMPDKDTLARIAGGTNSDRNRIKQRDDIEIGDTVWLDLEQGLLVSFFRRFHDKIEGVWNYPPEAIADEIEGKLELMITVDKNGELFDVDLVRTSGSDILDYEAIQAVYRAAPFGPLSNYYPHDKLHIHATFLYTISGKFIYGRKRYNGYRRW